MMVALMLGLHTGQRQGDLRRLTWAGYDGERLTLRQSKGKKVVSIKCTNALRTMLDGVERKGMVIMTTPSGRPWTKRYFNEHWHEASLAAGIADLHFHDLRGTAITMLGEAGCTPLEVAAITGHTFKHVTHILETYLSRTRHLADAAIIKLEKRLKKAR
jgi:integrase